MGVGAPIKLVPISESGVTIQPHHARVVERARRKVPLSRGDPMWITHNRHLIPFPLGQTKYIYNSKIFKSLKNKSINIEFYMAEDVVFHVMQA